MPPRAGVLLLALLVTPFATFCGGSPPQTTDREVEVRVQGLAVDRSSGTPVLILAEVGGKRKLPIWIGMGAARSIAAEIESIPPPRPNSHDLAVRLLHQLHGRLDRVVVTGLRDGVYYAELRIESNGEVTGIDARPSDAIAMALRVHARVYVREPVFAESALSEKEPAEPPGGGGHPSPHRQEDVLSL